MRIATRLLAAAALLAPPSASAAPCGGGLALPGTDTCVRLGGVARAEAAVAAPARLVPAAPGGRRAGAAAGARVELDARTPTAYGPVRTFLSVGAGGAAGR